jgi:triosephosphate isomerase (TIM)
MLGGVLTMEATRILRPLVAGNWKMNGLRSQLAEALGVRDALSGPGPEAAADVMICPPATLIPALAEAARGSKLLVGAQDCHPAAAGAHTGDIAAEMVADAGAVAVIVGHSERRVAHGELDRLVRLKAEAAHRAGLTAIVCIGETAGERAADLTLEAVGRQLHGSLPDSARGANTAVAYEPVWAIGTGRTPSAADVAQAHGAIREALVTRYGVEGGAIRILYGGSVNPGNARELLRADNVNGALVGGASLRASDLLAIVATYAH